MLLVRSHKYSRKVFKYLSNTQTRIETKVFESLVLKLKFRFDCFVTVSKIECLNTHFSIVLLACTCDFVRVAEAQIC